MCVFFSFFYSKVVKWTGSVNEISSFCTHFDHSLACCALLFIRLYRYCRPAGLIFSDWCINKKCLPYFWSPFELVLWIMKHNAPIFCLLHHILFVIHIFIVVFIVVIIIIIINIVVVVIIFIIAIVMLILMTMLMVKTTKMMTTTSTMMTMAMTTMAMTTMAMMTVTTVVMMMTIITTTTTMIIIILDDRQFSQPVTEFRV